MTYTTSSFLGPDFTPSPVRNLMIATCVVSLFCALTNNFFHQYLGMNGPQEWLSLSWNGVSSFFLWQIVTFLFVYSSGFYGISLFYLITLAFSIYIIWVTGSTICQHAGNRSFLGLYFASGIGAAVLALLTMPLTGQYPILSGGYPSILALLVVWTMLYPTQRVLLFFVFPMEMRWLVTGILGVVLLINLSHLDLVNLVFLLGGATIGYCYGLVVYGLQSPFPVTHRFDTAISRLFGSYKGKIIPISQGRKERSDAEFVDAMLEKISKKGEKSLSWRERRRMKKISEKKMKK